MFRLYFKPVTGKERELGVIPGMRPSKFPAGEYLTPCALIIGRRTASTDKKTSLNSALRDFGVPV